MILKPFHGFKLPSSFKAQSNGSNFAQEFKQRLKLLSQILSPYSTFRLLTNHDRKHD